MPDSGSGASTLTVGASIGQHGESSFAWAFTGFAETVTFATAAVSAAGGAWELHNSTQTSKQTGSIQSKELKKRFILRIKVVKKNWGWEVKDVISGVKVEEFVRPLRRIHRVRN
ncbi:MAG: hypothetical protein ABS34_04590 [Opitutaceae bacterium BACL24 MAG-120322-bin51]|nr:MAG: hypothetical protein ABS34_04590 [Opitutaceae bacterium BACL24 MAG-120322-bin51]